MSLVACVNGEFVALEKARVHIEDRGFQFADGVYEVIACYGGHFFDLDAHLDRLDRSLAAVAIPAPARRGELARLVRETYARNPYGDAMIYVQVTRGAAPRAHLAEEPLAPTCVITARALPAPTGSHYEDGVGCITLEDIRWRRCDVKSIMLLASVLGKREAAARGATEAIWLDESGHALEGCSTNILAVIDGALTTHPCDHRVLGGITRELVLELARERGMEVCERPWRLDEPGMSECMTSSTTSTVVPVVRIDGRPVGDGRPGPVAARLRAWMVEEIRRRVARDRPA